MLMGFLAKIGKPCLPDQKQREAIGLLSEQLLMLSSSPELHQRQADIRYLEDGCGHKADITFSALAFRTRSMTTHGTWQLAVAPAGMCPASSPSPMAPLPCSW